MPHKHTRREQDKETYDLPPDRIARALPTKQPAKETKKAQTSTTKPKNAAAKQAEAAAKRKRQLNADSVSISTKASHDTPRAFRRLMSLANGKRIRKGEDTGIVETKKQKKERLAKERAAAAKTAAAAAAAVGGGGEGGKSREDVAEGVAEGVAEEMTATTAAAAPAEPEAATDDASALKIRPGERLSDFNSRVNAALPLAGIVKKSVAGGAGGKDPLGLTKTYRTRQERKLHKLYDQWRKDDVKIKEREAEEREIVQEREDALDESLGVKWRLDFQEAGKKRGKKNKGGSGNNYVGEDDVWAAFNRKKTAETKSTVRAGVHDTVGAPPERLTKIDSSKFKFAQLKKPGGGGLGTAEVEAAIAEYTGKKTKPAAVKGVNKRLVAGRINKPGKAPARTRL
ncbi:hypothetical protein SCUCBS95973_005389 [Sporothrix curviconia]|uniref:Urease accessory protein n=1 Tax=Sporothrix curviconia TaxID=1260050 RepID=A0ABP0BWS4_9PEZI